MRIPLFAIILVLAGTAFGQVIPTPQFKCPQNAAQSCKSFSEMLTSEDPDVVRQMSPATHSLVCFKDFEDTFIIVSYNAPSNPPARPVFGYMRYSSFRHGQLDMSQTSFGKWVTLFQEVLFQPQPSSPKSGFRANAGYDDSEVFFSYPFKNIGGTVTNYSIKIRRSTLRFTELYEAPSTKKGEISHDENTGYCVDSSTITR